eukprot:TRINITY_DN5571_c0_g5_i1.p1 TRINITY_DN5571_c0_g5~~TRINITY_DN5571_c0_g5_i1.p1  ORF type:complete len:330 (+),score=59.12 TRINITY_DN5571_c0_g5_i1:92-991(+)
MLLSNPLKLPRLPIPALGATMQRWLDSVRPHAEGDAGKWEHAQKIAKEFEHGEGAELHRRLVERDASDAAFQGGGHYPHSYIERCWDDMYLEGRWALPINSNPVLVLQPPPKGYSPIDSDPQIATAAAFISSHVKYPSSVTSGAFEVDPGICAYQHALQVGTGRIAQQDRDRVTSHPSSRHIVVIANDRMYDLDVLSPPGKDGTRTHLSPKALARELSRIRAAAKAAGPPPFFSVCYSRLHPTELFQRQPDMLANLVAVLDCRLVRGSSLVFKHSRSIVQQKLHLNHVPSWLHKLDVHD